MENHQILVILSGVIVTIIGFLVKGWVSASNKRVNDMFEKVLELEKMARNHRERIVKMETLCKERHGHAREE